MEFIKIALVDDHKLFRKGLVSLIEMVHSNHSILFEADNGLDLQEKIAPKNLPDIILMDINMPNMNGIETVEWLKINYPTIKILVVSMVEKEETIVKMLKLGVKGYLSKDVEPKELSDALKSIMNKGYYYTDFITGKLIESLVGSTEDGNNKGDLLKLLSDREKEFLRLACTDNTYQEISSTMCVSPKTVDGYRNLLFEKLKVKSRVGLVIFAVKYGFVEL